jgi:hypothetical protein
MNITRFDSQCVHMRCTDHHTMLRFHLFFFSLFDFDFNYNLYSMNGCLGATSTSIGTTNDTFIVVIIAYTLASTTSINLYAREINENRSSRESLVDRYKRKNIIDEVNYITVNIGLRVSIEFIGLGLSRTNV